ncbi:hypothetical protein NOCA2540044 [metagenome]|uniref:Gluconate 2-dehydrogenase subunit 3 family protein n=1 Tax=metagenome TaxID=256318 RepID=A0A2P2C9W0_9ZZZZ
MAAAFPHTSRPGFHGLTLSPELSAYLAQLATALIPGDETYPSADEAQVVTFIQDRAAPDDLATLERLRREWNLADAPEVGSTLTELETGDPALFAYVTELVYHAYYSSRRVLAAMADRGYGYHGAPQPLGYAITETMAVPRRPRGSYVATEDVRRVSR